jgi:hypothetical protein
VTEDEADLPARLLRRVGSESFSKADFALDLFTIGCDDESGEWLKCPRYIREGLDWLSTQLGIGDPTVEAMTNQELDLASTGNVSDAP